jgi:hypothetical protein
VPRRDVGHDPQQAFGIEPHAPRPHPLARQVGRLIAREDDHGDSGCLQVGAVGQVGRLRRDVDEHDVAVLAREPRVPQL